ncbi:hypothetical protein ACQ4PT_025541 [Festuca glaucescens]
MACSALADAHGKPPSHAAIHVADQFIFSISRTSAPSVCKSGDGSKKRPRRQHDVRPVRSRSLRQWDLPQQASELMQKVVRTALVTGEASHSSHPVQVIGQDVRQPASSSPRQRRRAHSHTGTRSHSVLFFYILQFLIPLSAT